MVAKLWYIKERHNPQSGIYYVAQGRLSKTEAKRREDSLYGYNYMLCFNSEVDYEAELARLRKLGKQVI